MKVHYRIHLWKRKTVSPIHRPIVRRPRSVLALLANSQLTRAGQIKFRGFKRLARVRLNTNALGNFILSLQLFPPHIIFLHIFINIVSISMNVKVKIKLIETLEKRRKNTRESISTNISKYKSISPETSSN